MFLTWKIKRERFINFDIAYQFTGLCGLEVT